MKDDKPEALGPNNISAEEINSRKPGETEESENYIENSEVAHYFMRRARNSEIERPLDLFNRIRNKAEEKNTRLAPRHIDKILDNENNSGSPFWRELDEISNNEMGHYLAREARERNQSYGLQGTMGDLSTQLEDISKKRDIDLKEEHIDRGLDKIDLIDHPRGTERKVFGASNTEEFHYFARKAHERLEDDKQDDIGLKYENLEKLAEENGKDIEEWHLDRKIKEISENRNIQVFGTEAPEVAHYAHKKGRDIEVDPMDSQWDFTEGIYTKDDLTERIYNDLDEKMNLSEDKIDYAFEQLESMQDSEIEEYGDESNLTALVSKAVGETLEEYTGHQTIGALRDRR